jgi:uncharacterized heparinase superfamily protein
MASTCPKAGSGPVLNVHAATAPPFTKFTQLVRRVRWYAARLSAMPPAELPHRVVEAARRVAWRRERGGWEAFAAIGDGELVDLVALRSRLGATSCAAAETSVALTTAGRFEFLGEAWPAVPHEPDGTQALPPTFWFFDPITGKTWPDASTSSFSIDVRGSGAGIGDVKYVWEPNRLQMLHPLAASIARSGDKKLLRIALGILTSWAAANPPYRGVNWKSGIELALRLVSVALVVAAAGPQMLSPEERTLIRRMVAAHARYLAAFPSFYSSANNHRVAEGLGLFIAGVLAPDLDRVRGWSGEGRRILETETLRQILPDGVGAEQSPTYQAFTMELVTFAAQLAADRGRPLDAAVTGRLGRGAEYLSWLCDENGMAPSIGDDDEGRVIAQPPDREPRYIASVAAAVAGLLKRNELAVAPRDPHVRDLLFDSPPSATSDLPDLAPQDQAPQSQTSQAEPPHSGLKVFPQGGVCVINDTIGGRCVHLVFDHGPLGLLPLAAHGHADALAVWLSVNGEPVLIDAGTFRYFSGGGARTSLRESLLHNTLAVDGRSQSRASGAFGWMTTASAQLLGFRREPAWWVAGAHDGYQRRFGVRHVRTLRRQKDGIAIEDRLTGAHRPLPVALRFLCHPDITVTIDGGAAVLGGRHGPLCRIVAQRGFEAKIVAAATSPCFGRLVATRQLVLEGGLAEQPVVTQFVMAEANAPDATTATRVMESADAAAPA